MFSKLYVIFTIGIIVNAVTLLLLKRYGLRQSIRPEGPQGHQIKAGTPTMGGIGILLAFILSGLLYFHWSLEQYLILMVLLGMGLVGFLDDGLKIFWRRNLGLRAWQKMSLQLITAGTAAIFLLKVDYANLTGYWPLLQRFPILYLLWIVLVIVAVANAVNITDGLDGLAAGCLAIVFGGMVYLASLLNYPEIAVVALVLMLLNISFLIFNWHPAKIFMGDVGALAQGGALGIMALLMRAELVLVVMGGVFVIETLSVILQVSYFKYTKGKRIFRMSPLHHHFELGGWSELKVVFFFYAFCLICTLSGLLMWRMFIPD